MTYPLPSAPPISLAALTPEITVLSGACAVLLLGQARREAWRRFAPWLVLITLFVAIIFVVMRPWSGGAGLAAGNGLVYDMLATFVRNSALVLGVAITLVAWVDATAAERGEFWAMVLTSVAGVMLVGAAGNLLVLFIAVELVSVPTYVLVGLSRRAPAATEAATKYFYLGALSAAIMGYGFALLYGAAGSAALPAVAAGLADALGQPGTLAYGVAAVGIVFALGGLLFKVSAVPLHFYVADVYQGASSPVAGLLGFVPKFAGFVAILKIVLATGHWEDPTPAVYWLLWIVAALSMTVGNVLALLQTNVKRLLAYSGIAHAGYMLVGVLVGHSLLRTPLSDGAAAVLYYGVIYGLANLGAFAVLAVLRVRGRPCETLRDLAGLLRSYPGLALLMALAMLTLLGLPPTAGFWGKFALFGSALTDVANGGPLPHDSWLVALVIIALLNSAVSAAYYLRVTAAVLLYESDEPVEAVPHETPHVGAVLCGFLVLVFSFWPSLLLDQGRRATDGLRSAGPPGQMRGVSQPIPPVRTEEAARENVRDALHELMLARRGLHASGPPP